MIHQLEKTISAFAQLAVACTFGLAITIGVAGIGKTQFGCADCMPKFADAKRA
jgi:hypothetical protein